MAKRVPAPIEPRSLSDPTTLDSLERKAIADWTRRYNEIARRTIELFNTIDYTTITVNAARYVYDIRPEIIQRVMQELSTMVDDILHDGDTGDTNSWFFSAYVEPAYVRGTSQAFNNLSKQSPTYKAGAMSTRELMLKPPYQRRIALVQAREFELMKGVIGDTKSELGRVLTDGIARGRNPIEVAKTIRQQTGMSIGRAERIARTEMTTALKRARLDEADDAEEQYGVKTKQMHLSAFSPTTRPTHAARSGNLYTTDEVREWYSRSGNAINCKCSQTEVLVDDSGKPLLQNVGRRQKAAKAKWQEDHDIDLSTIDDEE